MTQDIWTAVDDYITSSVVGHDPVLEGALERSAAAGLPAISVSPPQGKLLFLLARAMRARRILELGTLGGYSTIWLARALPRGGRVVTLSWSPRTPRSRPTTCGAPTSRAASTSASAPRSRRSINSSPRRSSPST